MKIAIHPLVLLNITDHATRCKIGSKKTKPNPIFGAILLKSDSQQPEISNSFQLINGLSTNPPNTIDIKFLTSRLSKYQQVYKEVEFVGLYYASPAIQTGQTNKTDLQLISQLAEYTSGNAQFYLKVDTDIKRLSNLGTHDPLPITLYEINRANKGQIELKPVSYQFKSQQGERVAVSDAAQLVPQNAQNSSFAANGNKNLTALMMLKDKMTLLQRLICDDGKFEEKLKKNPAIGRKLMELQSKLSSSYLDVKLDGVMHREVQKMNLMSAGSLVFSGERILQALQFMNNSMKKNEHMIAGKSVGGPKRFGIGQKLPGFEGDYDDDQPLDYQQFQ